MADKVYLTPTPGSSGHRGGGGEEEEEAETLFRLQTVVTGKYLESCEETGWLRVPREGYAGPVQMFEINFLPSKQPLTHIQLNLNTQWSH